jgi:hypothetical protein
MNRSADLPHFWGIWKTLDAQSAQLVQLHIHLHMAEKLVYCLNQMWYLTNRSLVSLYLDKVTLAWGHDHIWSVCI